MSGSQMETALKLAAEFESADQLSRQLARSGILTAWQAAQLLKGQSGFVLGHYRLLDSIGRGGMGHVFRAVDSRNSSIVAIKVMSRKLSSNQHLVNRFRREIRASSRLNDPHIVRSLDAGRVGNIDFMVMEYVNGEQLDNVIAGLPSIPVAQACEIIRQTALGLQHAFEKQMVHRDIKPSNLMLDWTDDGEARVRIMDMGLVRLLDDDEERTAVTRAGQVMGTPDYMSPEQGWNTAAVDIRSDIYSLGCTFFRLLTGRVPFQGDNPLQVLMVRCSKDAPSVRSVRPELAEPIDAIVSRMIRRDPDQRFQTPQELADALEPFSGPITVASLQAKVKTPDDPETSIELQLAATETVGDLQDPGYHQFLREMDTGAAVDLMLAATPTGASGTVLETPEVRPAATVTVRNPRAADRSAAARKRRSGMIVMAIAALPVCAGLLYFALSGPAGPGRLKQDQNAAAAAELKIPEATLAYQPPRSMKVNEQLEFEPVFDGAPPEVPAAGRLFWRLTATAPEGVTIDEKTGTVRWTIPPALGSAAHVIPIELCFEHEDQITVISSTQLVVSVGSDPSAAKYQLQTPGFLRVQPGEEVVWDAQVEPALPESAEYSFRLAGEILPAMQFSPDKGQLRWTPAADDLGRWRIVIQLIGPGGAQISEAARVVMVRPASQSLSITTPSTAVARRGEKLSVPLLADVTPPGVRSLLQAELISAPQPGISIDAESGMLTWDVPADASGTVECTWKLVTAASDFNVQIEGGVQRKLTLRIDNSDTSAAPDAAAVATASAALQKLYRRELATAARRPEELRRLLEICYLQEQGTDDFALLQLISDEAENIRVPDTVLEALLLRFERYGISPLQESLLLVTELRTSGLADHQEDRLLEQLLRLALLAAEAEQWQMLPTFLTPAAEITRKAGGRPAGQLFAEDVRKALEISESLQQADAAAGQVRQSSLQELLRGMQFSPVFHRPDLMVYVQAGQTAELLSDSGRTLWEPFSGGLSLPAAERSVSLGFLDRTTGGDRWVLRIQVDGGSAVAALILAADTEPQVTGMLLGLDSLSLGQVITFDSTPQTLSPRTNSTAPPRDGWNDFEIQLNERNLRLIMNGTSICQVTLPQLSSGLTGMMADRQTAAAGPALRFRNARILRLSDSAEN